MPSQGVQMSRQQSVADSYFSMVDMLIVNKDILLLPGVEEAIHFNYTV